MYRIIEPEVAGSLGNKTEMDTSIHPPIIKSLHFEFDGWLGDDLLETFPCFIITRDLKLSIEDNNLSGISFDNVIITKSETFKELYNGRNLPKFYWAKINGKPYDNDFFLGADYRLHISEKAFSVLKKFKIDNAIIEDNS